MTPRSQSEFLTVNAYNYSSHFRCRCFVGDEVEMSVEDCIARDKSTPNLDPRETSRSVSEMKEWVCSKITKPDGSVSRDCMRLYTGGEAFRVCYTNRAQGSTCLCSAELCNTANHPATTQQLCANIALTLIVLLFYAHSRNCC